MSEIEAKAIATAAAAKEIAVAAACANVYKTAYAEVAKKAAAKFAKLAYNSIGFDDRAAIRTADTNAKVAADIAKLTAAAAVCANTYAAEAAKALIAENHQIAQTKAAAAVATSIRNQRMELDLLSTAVKFHAQEENYA